MGCKTTQLSRALDIDRKRKSVRFESPTGPSSGGIESRLTRPVFGLVKAKRIYKRIQL